jgi:hypothetical protein
MGIFYSCMRACGRKRLALNLVGVTAEKAKLFVGKGQKWSTLPLGTSLRAAWASPLKKGSRFVGNGQKWSQFGHFAPHGILNRPAGLLHLAAHFRRSDLRRSLTLAPSVAYSVCITIMLVEHQFHNNSCICCFTITILFIIK